MGDLEKFCAVSKGYSDSSIDEGNKPRDLAHIHGMKQKILNQVKNLSVEAGGKGSANKKDLNSQRNSFRDILEFLEVLHAFACLHLNLYDVIVVDFKSKYQDGYSPETSMKIGGEFLNTSSWYQLIQVTFLCPSYLGFYGFECPLFVQVFLISLSLSLNS